MSPLSTDQDTTFSRANSIRRWTLYGLGIGLLVGLIWVGLAPPEGNELVSIARWRNMILLGGAFGFLFGAFRPAPKSRETTTNAEKTAEEHHA